MLYTDGHFLMGDTQKELHQVAQELHIPGKLFTKNPFPCYKLDKLSRQKVLERNIPYMLTANMLFFYYSRLKTKR